MNIVIFRENTEDVYAGIEWREGTPQAKRLIEFINQLLREDKANKQIRLDSGVGIKPMSVTGTKQLVRRGIRYAVEHGHKIGKAAVHQRVEPPGHLGEIGRDQLERRGAVEHGVLVDSGDGGKVGLDRGPDFKRGHGPHDISRSIGINAVPPVMAGLDPAIHVFGRQERGCPGQARA